MFYNLYFSIKYDVYINVKICANVEICKYIFKYVYKSNNRVNFRIKREKDEKIDIKSNFINEIQEYRDARWINSVKVY